MWTPCPVMHVDYRIVRRSHLKLSTNFVLAFLLHVSLHCLGTMASPMVRKDVGYTPGSCQNGSEIAWKFWLGKQLKKCKQYW